MFHVTFHSAVKMQDGLVKNKLNQELIPCFKLLYALVFENIISQSQWRRIGLQNTCDRNFGLKFMNWIS